MYKLLSILAGELILAYVSELLVHNGRLLSLRIKYWSALSNLAEAADDRRMNQSNGLVDIRVVYARDQGSLCFLYQVLLDGADARHVLDVLVEAGVDGHVLGAHSKALFVLVFVCDADDKGDARGIFLHHVQHKSDS